MIFTSSDSLLYTFEVDFAWIISRYNESTESLLDVSRKVLRRQRTMPVESPEPRIFKRLA